MRPVSAFHNNFWACEGSNKPTNKLVDGEVTLPNIKGVERAEVHIKFVMIVELCVRQKKTMFIKNM